MGADTIDVVREQWATEFPHLDTRALGITHRITALATRINRDAEAVFAQLGISSATFDLVAALYAAGPPFQRNPTQLNRGRLPSAGMTARLDLAEEAGLLARSRSQNDRRGVTVTLTDRGVRVVRAGLGALLAVERDLSEVPSAAEREGIPALLTKLLNSPAEHSSTSEEPSSTEALISSWLRAFPSQDPWLVHFLGAIPLLSGRVERVSTLVVGAMGLTPNAFGLLCALRRSGAPYRLSPSELYDVVILSPAGVAGHLYKMERAGLIERSNDPDDRRFNRAGLTTRGQKVVNDNIGDFVMRHEWLLRSLSEDERDELSGLLRRLLSAVEGRRSELVDGH
jgi:DNA-binding MarR family transcriptional regulator